ncbi:hypothetical protein O181_069850 [Austropuccinia psidii MF-1]|uniref:Cas1p 10 TM acyl transferase domain-containing protein n=1 Tax=Austropuccinia psidii MF-1 TaxID=1389203 RepID=A0A9Q3F3P4_9BASI|nr:hypothetical protein [Austropuccinia psidii MF-1]
MIFKTFLHSLNHSSINFIYLISTLIAVLLLLASHRIILIDWSDPFHCNALLNSGRWLDGSNHKNWQPDGCMIYSYKPKSVIDCLTGQSVVFIGDSISRSLFYSTLRNLDPLINSDGQPKHSSRSIETTGSIHWNFIWDPFLNSSSWSDLLNRNFKISNSFNSISRTYHPTLLVISSGLWFLRQKIDLAIWRQSIDNLFNSSISHLNQPPIAHQIVLLPIQYPLVEKLSPERKQTITIDQIDQMNHYILQASHSNPSSSIQIPNVMNLLTNQSSSESIDGLHYSNKLTETQAKILLNLRCNNQLIKKFPLDKTCCSKYPTPNPLQVFILLFLLLWAPIGLYIYHRPTRFLSSFHHLFPSKDTLIHLATFCASIILIFLSDRTTLFNKEHKQFNLFQFTFLNLLALFLALGSAQTSEKGDLGLLNREQTDEWKGWMQIAILIYHYLAASQISGIYNPIRVCVAGYLFMSGYGHFTYYYLKKDFGFPRILSVLVRLNLLTVVLAFVMDTDYLSYYFSPLVSMWFLVIWATMFIGYQWNDHLWFILAKLSCSAAVVAAFFKSRKPLESLFTLTNRLFGTEWFASEWTFRVTLDIYIVYWGMLAALAYLKVKENRFIERQPQIWDQVQRHSIWISCCGLIWFFWFELTRPNKLIYNRYHPYLSIIPIASFIILRNSTPFLRSTNCKLFVFIGQCSLETFIIQFHLWLAADTKGILKVLPWPGFRVLNFILSTIVFIFISYHVSQSTGQLTSWLCHKPKKTKQDNQILLDQLNPSTTVNIDSSHTYLPISVNENQNDFSQEQDIHHHNHHFHPEKGIKNLLKEKVLNKFCVLYEEDLRFRSAQSLSTHYFC